MTRPVKFSLWIGGVALLIVALFGHWYCWYAPRARTGSPGVKASTSQVFFGTGDLPLRLWIPFPHQNLAALERAIGDLEGVSEVSSYLISQDLASLPSFGPFRLPPARDLVVAGSQNGDRIVVAASVYPVVAWLARVAGRLAGNAWLAGGPVELHGRTVEVEWRDGMWLAAQGEVARTVGQPVPDLVPSHALLRLDRSLGPVPQGLYRLDVEARGWRIVSAEPEAMQASDARVRAVLPSGLALVAASIGPGSAPDSAVETFVMLSGGRGAGEQIASSVIAHRGTGDRWQLPAERLLSGLGFEVSEGAREGWSLAAYDEAAIDQVADRLSSISDLLGSVDEAPLELGIWLDLAEAREALDGLVSTLGSLPLPATEQIRLWTMAARSLASLDNSGSLSLRIGGSPSRLEMRLDREGL
ncbi:MAG: hypothetical protein WBO69_00325 [Thermoanaerobaculia bacterium]